MRHFTMFTTALLLGVSATAFASPPSHGPFEPGTEPKPIHLRECVATKERRDPNGIPQSVSYAISQDKPGTAVTVELHDKGCQISVSDKAGKPLLATPAVSDLYSVDYFVHSADFNGDGIPDYVVRIWSGGVGLGGELSSVTFLVSHGTRYEAQTFETYDFGPEDIVRLTPKGPYYFVHPQFMTNETEKTKDGRDHSFWVYELYRFDRDGLKLANSDDPRFPKWVWYTTKPNHRETDQLTPRQKQRLLKRAHATTEPAR